MEGPLVEMLSGRQPVSRLIAGHGEVAVLDALTVLRSRDAVVECERIGIADLAKVGDLGGVSRTDLTSIDDVGGLERLAVVGVRNDARIGDYVQAAHAAGVPLLLAWISPVDVVLCADEPGTSPCVLCALRFDALAPRHILPVDVVVAASAASDSDAKAIARGLVERFIAPGAGSPPPGRALVFELQTCTTSWESFPRHPACTCLPKSDEAATFLDRAPRWDDFDNRRFSPVIPVERHAQGVTAHVLYPGRSSPWPVARASYGVALAAGPHATDRALSEAFERFAMLHAAPDVVGRAARDLDEASLDPLAIASLLHGEDQYALERFRFPRFSSDLVLDWSWAEYARGTGRLLVPTSLIGRPSDRSARLCDATSNGYACHSSRDEARSRALLEVCERDALLLAWYGDTALPHIDGLAVPRGWSAFLATQDVDAPVVLLATCREDGSLCTGSAAALSFDAAVDGALVELEGQLGGRPPSEHGSSLDLRRTEVRYGPSHHVAFYAGARGREGFAHLARCTERLDAVDLRRRWPSVSAASAADDVVERFANAGLEALFVDRSLPELFGRWRIVRALVPRAVEMSFGQPYRRLASPRLLLRMGGREFSTWPHPFA
jgi:thiazole/oxazole-forming peptide maturase SagD family component